MNQITIANHAEGAPFVKVDGQILPIQLSISHREGMAAVGLSINPEISLGIDLEWVEDHPHSFYEDFFTAGEVNLLAAVSADRLAWTGTLIWSAKEAMLKALGKGLRLDTRTVEITGISRTTVDGWGSIDMRIANINDKCFQGVWRECGPYVLTMAIRNAKNRPVFHRID
ncbi:4'-phosphopantetheinyl transferase superfamily protein [bacterium]|nr:4'-phosphopantetheinyl transferase superfamily protein [bacterium]